MAAVAGSWDSGQGRGVTRARLVREVGAREARGAGDSPRVRIQVEPRRQVAQPVGVVDERHREGAAAAGVVDDADALDAHHRRERGGHVAAERRRPRHHPELEGGGALAALAARRHDVVDVLESSAGRRAADEPRRRMRDEAEPARQGGARGEGGVAVGGRDGCGGRAQRHGALRERVAHLHVELRGRQPGLVRRERPILVGEHRGARAERREAAADVGRALRHAEPQQRRRHAAVVARHDHVLGGRGGAARRAAHRAVRRVEAEAVGSAAPRAPIAVRLTISKRAPAPPRSETVLLPPGGDSPRKSEGATLAKKPRRGGRRTMLRATVAVDEPAALYARTRKSRSPKHAWAAASGGHAGVPAMVPSVGSKVRPAGSCAASSSHSAASTPALHSTSGSMGTPSTAARARLLKPCRRSGGGPGEGEGGHEIGAGGEASSARGRARRAARAHLRPRRTAARSASR